MNNLKLEITGKAYSDIETIADYIAIDNLEAAKNLIELFNKAFDKLTYYPDLGKIRKDFTYLNVKFYVIKKRYLIVYRIIDNSKLRILRVLTTYQDICKQL